MYISLCLKNKVNEFLTDEKGEVNIVAIVVLIGIAIILAVFFKKEIIELLKNLFKTINTQATNAITGSTE